MDTKSIANGETKYKHTSITIEDIMDIKAKKAPYADTAIIDYSEIKESNMPGIFDGIQKIAMEHQDIGIVCDLAMLYLQGATPSLISNNSIEQCSKCVHNHGGFMINGSTCYLCKRNPENDNRIDWYEPILNKNAEKA